MEKKTKKEIVDELKKEEPELSKIGIEKLNKEELIELKKIITGKRKRWWQLKRKELKWKH